MDVRSGPPGMPDNRARYWREISAVLALKALGLTFIYLLCFGSSNGVEPGAVATFRHLMSSSAGATVETSHD